MQKIKLIDNQTFLDACLVGCGSITHAVEMAILNSVSITDLRTAGEVLNVPDVRNEMKTYFFVKQISIATDVKINPENGGFELPSLLPMSL